MSNDNIDQTQASDPLDELLHSAFDEALAGPTDQFLVNQVMAQIERRQRLRTLVLALFGFVALLICLLGAAPLFELIPAMFSDLFNSTYSSTEESSANMLSLPAAAATAMLLAGVWLLMEEVTG